MVLEILENIAQTLIKMADKDEPALSITRRSRDNVIFTPEGLKIGDKKIIRKLLSEPKTFAQTIGCLRAIIEARRDGLFPNIRDIYYNANYTVPELNVDLYSSQTESDSAIIDIEVLTGLLREEIGLTADSKGVVTGSIILESEGETIDCSKMGKIPIAIPSVIGEINIKRVDAKFVLVVEKKAVFDNLKSIKFWQKWNCILISGSGQPDRATRHLTRRLAYDHGLPVGILVDSGPYGFSIYSVYKVGSISLAHETEKLACPKAKFLGVSVSDIDTYKIPSTALKSATPPDLKRAKDLLAYPWFKTPFWQKELNLFLKKKKKAEIESLSRHGFKFLVDTYLPEKLKQAGIV